MSVTSHNANPIKITSFTIRAKLWYAINTDPLEYTEAVSYITTATPFNYNSSLWNTPQLVGNEYTFTASGTHYIPYGYEMQLINGITIPAQTYESADLVTVRDLWCAMEIVAINYEEVTEYSANSNYANIEVSAPNQYVPISSNGAGYITIKNNTNQVVTSATLGLTLQATDSNVSFEYDVITGADYTVVKAGATSSTLTTQTFANLNIYPNERVVLCKIVPEVRCTINSCSVQVVLSNNAIPNAIVSRRIEQTDINYNRSYIVNTSSIAYQVRINSEQDLSNILSADDFVFSADKKYAYYVGVVYPNQVIDLGNMLTNNVKYDLQLVEYDLNTAPSFTDWSLSGDTAVSAWQAKMHNIFALSQTEQEIEDIIDEIKNSV